MFANWIGAREGKVKTAAKVDFIYGCPVGPILSKLTCP